MAERPRRKKLRLEGYDYSESGYYFLTICTRNKVPLLSEIKCNADKESFVALKPYGEIAQTFIRSIPGIEKYVIMPNHVHMIIHKTNGKSIVSDIRSLKGLVTKTIGEGIWQESYYDHIIRNEEDYLEKWRYIDNNPARWAEDEYNSRNEKR